MRAIFLIGFLLLSSASLAQSLPPAPQQVDVDDFVPDAGETPREMQLPQANGFYSNAPSATAQAARARRATSQSMKSEHLRVAPADQLQARCLIECKRLGDDEAACKIGCAR